MDSRNHKRDSFEWGIVGVNLDDIELSWNQLNNMPAHFKQDPQASVLHSDNAFSGSSLGLVDSSKESVSIFDRFPEAFRSNSDEQAGTSVSVFGHLSEPPVAKDQLPYSWMIQNPGKVPQGLDINCPRPQHIKPQAGNKSASNVEGETQIEEQLKLEPINPHDYFLQATAFTCIMDLNSQGLIHPTLLAILIGRIFRGEARFLDVFNRFFMPPGFRIEPTNRRPLLQECLVQMDHHLATHPAHACHTNFVMLNKIVRHFAFSRVRIGNDIVDVVGKLVCSSNGIEFMPSPGAHAMLHGPKLSPQFLSRRGEWWPFRIIPWREADLLGLYSTDRVAVADSTRTIDPRLLPIRGIPRVMR